MVTKEDVIEALKEVLDPEIMIDVYTLELIYNIKIKEDKVDVVMTFTTPLCPYGPQLKEDVRKRVAEVKGVKEVEVEITFNPKWEPSDELRAILGV